MDWGVRNVLCEGVGKAFQQLCVSYMIAISQLVLLRVTRFDLFFFSFEGLFLLGLL